MKGSNPPNLQLVPEGSRSGEGQVTPVEDLSAGQRAELESLRAATKIPGVLVGVFSLFESWDLRPVTLNAGALWVLRFSHPALPVDGRYLQEFLVGIGRVGSLGERSGGVDFGQVNGQVWVNRRYADRTLSTALEDLPGDPHHQPFTVAQALVNQVYHLHRNGLIHGHICENNVALFEGNVELVDFGCSAFYPNPAEVHSNLAPEFFRREPLTPAVDIYGLGLVLRGLLRGGAMERYRVLIDRMLLPQPDQRPSISEVRAVFIPQSAEVRTIRSGTSEVRSQVIRQDHQRVSSGRLIGEPETPAPQLQYQAPPIAPPVSQPVAATPPLASPPSHSGAIPQTEVASENSAWTLLLGLVVILVFLLGGVLYKQGQFDFLVDSQTSTIPYQEFWESNRPSLMLQVAEAALVEGNLAAERVIVGDALAGNTRPGIPPLLLSTAFDSAWESELSPQDRDVALRFALLTLVPQQRENLRFIGQAHPGVVLAVAGTVSTELRLPGLDTLPLQVLFELPDPYGVSFRRLQRTGVELLGSSVARSLCHILVGDISGPLLEEYLRGAGDWPQVEARLQVLLRAFERDEATLSRVFGGLQSLEHPVSRLAGWFDGNGVLDWETVPARDRLRIMGGLLTQVQLSPEYLADLLKFPGEFVSSWAIETLSQQLFNGQSAETLKLVGGPQNNLTRQQSVALVLALRVRGEEAYSYVSSWFETRPPADFVARLLVSRSGETDLDPISIESARYLKGRNFELSLKELERLASHREPLARALAYTNLDLNNPVHRRLLEGMAVVEPSPRLREELQRRLKGDTEELDQMDDSVMF